MKQIFKIKLTESFLHISNLNVLLIFLPDNENSNEKVKKELLRSKKREKSKDKGYATLDAESSGDEMDYIDIKYEKYLCN